MADAPKWVVDTTCYTHLSRAGHVAILDDRAAVEQARLLRVTCHGTLGIVIEAYKRGILVDRQRTAGVVDDLISTGMYLPLESGESLLAWAYKEGLLP
jgi:predicted nucleic acid-binding protein